MAGSGLRRIYCPQIADTQKTGVGPGKARRRGHGSGARWADGSVRLGDWVLRQIGYGVGVALFVLLATAQVSGAADARPIAADPAKVAPASGLPLQAVALQNVPAEAGPAELSPFVQALVAAIGNDRPLAAFYQARDYQPIWTNAADAARRQAFFEALAGAADQGLPAGRYDLPGIIAKLRAANTVRDRAAAEIALSKDFLQYARDAASGVLTPADIAPGIVRDIARPKPEQTLDALATAADPAAFLRGLLPQAPQYNELLKAKLRLEQEAAADAWGPPVAAKSLKPGQTGPAVVALRDRLIAMGYLAPTATADYDAVIAAAVSQFQADHGLPTDGVAGADTMSEVNLQPADRLKSVIVAMERWRWMPRELGERYVWVNLPDFAARVFVGGKQVFESRAVIGKNSKDTRTPEFSNVMRYMDVNPTWNVPRSIVTKEYLPQLQADPTSESQLQLVDSRGQVVDRKSVDFSQYDADTFPYELKQPPSDGNALGLVKFMFPNKYNIYLHDTPSKYLFKNHVRAYSHGCIRLQRPFDLANLLLGWQSASPEAEFKTALAKKVESVIDLKEPLPVHLVYFTAYPDLGGHMQYRRDVYGRDARLFAALQSAGVALGAKPN